MTEFWKSRAMHWCDVCKCWLNDTKQAIQHHERGMGHQANLQRKLREMGKKADSDKRKEEFLTKEMDKIEDNAAKKYALDKKEAEEAAAATSGRWEWDEGSTYYYNALFRWYYDPKTQWYYGGEPVEWVQSPASLPAHARFGVAPHEGGPVAQGAKPAAVATGTAAAGASRAGAGQLATTSTSAAVAAGAAKTTVVRKVVELPKHPLHNIGGHAMPTIGRVGAAKGVAGLDTSGDKRKRDEGGKGSKAVDAAEAEAIARREAARQRVAQRTASQFGFV